MTELFSSASGSQRNLRIVLFVIILATFPFYCLGFILWGAAPQSAQPVRRTPSVTPLTVNTLTPTTGGLVTNTPLQVVTVTPIGPVPSTPTQFFPPNLPPPVVIPPTQFIPPTVFIPPPTLAPTLTPIPPTIDPGPTTTTIPFFPTDTPTS